MVNYYILVGVWILWWRRVRKTLFVHRVIPVDKNKNKSCENEKCCGTDECRDMEVEYNDRFKDLLIHLASENSLVCDAKKALLLDHLAHVCLVGSVSLRTGIDCEKLKDNEIVFLPPKLIDAVKLLVKNDGRYKTADELVNIIKEQG